MSETKTRYYHLYADGKTVKELSPETYRAMCREGHKRFNTRLIVAVYPKDIDFHKGKQNIFVQLEQLQQILRGRLR